MAYQKTEWKDQVVENPRTYSVKENLDGTITLFDAFGEITELGTPVNAENMNKIEQGIYDAQRVVGDIGDVYYTLRTDVPAGGAWCDGAEYTQEAFPDIYQMLVDGKLQKTDYATFNSSVSTNGYCDLFALDTATTSFKVPKLLDKFVVLSDDELPVKGNGITLGLTDGANNFGLRNRTVISTPVFASSTGSYNTPAGTNNSSGSMSDNGLSYGITTDPAKSGIVAENTTKYAVYKAYVVLYASAAGASEVQAAEFINALTNKANIDLSNVNALGKETSVAWGMPDYTAGVDLGTVPLIDSPYTAPSAGVFVGCWTQAVSGNCYVYINGVKSGFSSTAPTTYRNGEQYFIPLSKGDKLYFDVNSDIFVSSYFYPLKGVNNA